MNHTIFWQGANGHQRQAGDFDRRVHSSNVLNWIELAPIACTGTILVASPRSQTATHPPLQGPWSFRSSSSTDHFTCNDSLCTARPVRPTSWQHNYALCLITASSNEFNMLTIPLFRLRGGEGWGVKSHLFQWLFNRLPSSLCDSFSVTSQGPDEAQAKWEMKRWQINKAVRERGTPCFLFRWQWAEMFDSEVRRIRQIIWHALQKGVAGAAQSLHSYSRCAFFSVSPFWKGYVEPRQFCFVSVFMTISRMNH